MIFEYDIFEYVYLQETIETWPTLQMPWTSHSEASGDRNQAMASDFGTISRKLLLYLRFSKALLKLTQRTW